MTNWLDRCLVKEQSRFSSYKNYIFIYKLDYSNVLFIYLYFFITHNKLEYFKYFIYLFIYFLLLKKKE